MLCALQSSCGPPRSGISFHNLSSSVQKPQIVTLRAVHSSTFVKPGTALITHTPSELSVFSVLFACTGSRTSTRGLRTTYDICWAHTIPTSEVACTVHHLLGTTCSAGVPLTTPDISQFNYKVFIYHQAGLRDLCLHLMSVRVLR